VRILHVVDFSLPHRQSGYSIRTHYIVTTQRKLGWDPIVLSREAGLAVRSEAFPVVEEILDGVTHLREPALSLEKGIVQRLEQARDFRDQYPHGIRRRFRKHISRAVRKHAPDLIHAASPSTVALWSMDVGEQWGIPVVYEVRGIWHDTSVALGQLEESSEVYALRHRQFLDALARADGIVTLAETLKAEFVREGIPAEAIGIVPNGVDLDRFAPRQRPRKLAEGLEISADELVIGHIGAIRNLEGLHLLLGAADALRRTGLRFRVVVVGDGSELANLESLARERDLEPMVHFVMPRTRSRVTELVTPIKPYEAMAKAVVVSDVAALREIVSDGETGLVCAADDAKDLAEKCGALLRDRELRERLGRQARQWVVEHRGWSTVVRRYGAVYEEVLERKSRSEPTDPGRAKRIVFCSAGVGTWAVDGRSLPSDLEHDHEIRVIEALEVERARGTMEGFVPDVVLVEAFPFGLRERGADLLGLIDAANAAHPDVDVVCLLDGASLGSDGAEVSGQEICLALYAHFDAVLVLGDPQEDRIEDRLSWAKDIYGSRGLFGQRR
jgi:glycosyltransferase involved in cell wall biosynthesis